MSSIITRGEGIAAAPTLAPPEATRARALDGHSLKYRKDIEGLRAVAIIPVVLFHAGVRQVSGGFVGVDVFFVISGFLITSIIAGEIAEGSFSLLGFYSRRVVRILPALLTMLVIVAGIGTAVLFPTALRSLFQSAAAAALFVPNFYFWDKASYFSTNADLQALLHTWSLGVEEQFYIFYPFFLMVLSRFGRRVMALGVVTVVAASLALSLGLVLAGSANAAFYLLPSRAWELGIGAMVALKLYPAIGGGRLRNLLSLLGLGAILVSLFIVSSTNGFPAPWALLPCAGAALLIAYGQSAATSSLLGFPVVLWIGRISYSLYLWHWPIIFFYRSVHGAVLSPGESAVLVLASLAAAWLSYTLVERPFLRRFRRAAPKRTVPLGVAGAVGIMALALAGSASADNLRHFDPAIQRLIAYDDYTSTTEYRYQFRPGKCFIDSSTGSTQVDPKCLALSDTRPNLIVAGDSLAAHYWRAFALRFPGRNVVQATAPSCRTTIDPVGTESCRAVVDAVLGPLADSGKVDAVFLSGEWTEADLPKLAATIHLLRARNIRVTVAGPPVQYNGQYPELLARATMQNNPAILDGVRIAARKQMSDRMAGLVRQAGATFVSVYDLECPQGVCRLTDRHGAPVNFDCCHLTLPMAIELVGQFPAP